MGKHYTISQINEAIADIRRVRAATEDEIVTINRMLWRIQEEADHAGSLSAVRPYEAIEADEESARSLLQGLRYKRGHCDRKLNELEDAKREIQFELARARREALAEQSARKARKRKVSG